MASVYIQLPLVTSTVSGTISVEQLALTPSYAQSLTVSDGSVTTLSAPAGAKKAKVWAGSNGVNLRITLDGTTPSATVGHVMEPNRSEDFDGVSSLKAIAESTASNQVITVHWSY